MQKNPNFKYEEKNMRLTFSKFNILIICLYYSNGFFIEKNVIV